MIRPSVSAAPPGANGATISDRFGRPTLRPCVPDGTAKERRRHDQPCTDSPSMAIPLSNRSFASVSQTPDAVIRRSLQAVMPTGSLRQLCASAPSNRSAPRPFIEARIDIDRPKVIVLDVLERDRH